MTFLLLACRVAGPPVLGTESMGTLEQSELIQGRDGGLSGRVWDRSVWLYGDTVLNVEDELGQTWHHNSVSWTLDDDADDFVTGFEEPLDGAGAPSHFLAPTETELAFNLDHYGDDCAVEPCGARYAVWPGAPVWDDEHQRALVLYGLIYAEPGDMNFEGVGTSVAVWSDPDAEPERPEVGVVDGHPDLMWDATGPAFGPGALIHEGHFYAFSCESRWLAHRCVLGRAPLGAVTEAGAWEVRAGDGWTSALDEGEVLFEGAPIMSASWSEHHGAWLLVYSHPFSDEVVARTAPEPWGPWSREEVLFRVEGEAPYDAVHHAEYERDGGRVQVVTWSRPTDEGWFGAELGVERVIFE